MTSLKQKQGGKTNIELATEQSFDAAAAIIQSKEDEKTDDGWSVY